MSFKVNISDSRPATTECVFGITEDKKYFNLDLDGATVEQQKICADFLNLVKPFTTIDIINSAHNFENVVYIVQTDVTLDIKEVDYTALSNPNKGKINAFANLLKSLAQ